LQGDLMAIKESNFACVYMPNISWYDSVSDVAPGPLVMETDEVERMDKFLNIYCHIHAYTLCS
jgi:hypothetical protein